MTKSDDMKITLWEDFIHIETSHVCCLGAFCNGMMIIELWASFYAPRLPPAERFCVHLSLTAQKPETNDDYTQRMRDKRLERRCEPHTVTLLCTDSEDLQIDARISSDAKGWKVEEGDSSFHLKYTRIKHKVVYHSNRDEPLWTSDFRFLKVDSSGTDVHEFTPAFKFSQGTTCLLRQASQYPADIVSSDQDDDVSGTHDYICCLG